MRRLVEQGAGGHDKGRRDLAVPGQQLVHGRLGGVRLGPVEGVAEQLHHEVADEERGEGADKRWL